MNLTRNAYELLEHVFSKSLYCSIHGLAKVTWRNQDVSITVYSLNFVGYLFRGFRGGSDP